MSASPPRFDELFQEGMAALGRADLAAARSAFETCTALQPENAEAWCYLGISLTFQEPWLAMPALERALAIHPDHHGALYWRAEAQWTMGDPNAAAQALRRLNDLVPGVPNHLARMGFAYLSAGNGDDAEVAFRAAIDAGDGLDGVASTPTELRRAIYLDVLGRREESLDLVRKINQSGVRAEYPRDRYPRDLEDQLCALEDIVGGRDIVILGSGPSLGALPPLLEQLGQDGRDQLCFFGFNNVPVAERLLKESTGRGVDLACMTSAAVMELHADWIAAFLDREHPPGLFLTLADAMKPGRTVSDLLARRMDRLFVFAANGDHPPIPEDPLHFPPVNGLLCVLPLAVLASPRRIFLFGCDGAAPSAIDRDAEVYFRQGSADYKSQRIFNARYAWWLARDTQFFNAMIPTVLASLSLLHRIPVAPIYTCNPDSAYQPFPRISGQEFLALQRARPAVAGFHPAMVNRRLRQIEQLNASARAESERTLAAQQAQATQAFKLSTDSLARTVARIRELEGKVNQLRSEMDAIKRFVAPLRAVRRLFR